VKSRIVNKGLDLSVWSAFAVATLISFTVAVPASAQSFTLTGGMSIRRDDATATQLLSDKILVAGGDDGTGSRGTAELYDPTTGAFTATGSMVLARQSQTATLLQNGTVLVAGGIDNNGNTTNTAEIYNPATGTFSSTGNMTEARESHTATLLPDGEVLVTGGGDTSAAETSAELYNPSTGTFTATGSMHEERIYHTATLLADGQVLVAGGPGASGGTADATAELYKPAQGVFTLTGSMATGRYSHPATLLLDGRVLVAGGESNNGLPTNTAEVYNPATGEFSSGGTMTTARAFLTSTLLSNGEVLLAGGLFVDPNHGPGPSTTSDLFNPTTNSIAQTVGMNDVRSFAVESLLFNGLALVAGGGTNTAELYAPASMPATKIIAPISGSLVEGTVNIFATISTSSVRWINIYIDGKYLASSPPFGFSWDSTKVANGNHTILVRAYSGSSQVGSDSITVDVQNAVKITAPANGATVSKTATITVQKASGVSWVNVYIDGNYFASTPPSSFKWNTTTFANGAHTISAQAYSSSDQEVGSTSIAVIVKN
jgi:hypothetical protein